MDKFFKLLCIFIFTFAFQTGCADSVDENEAIKPETELDLTEGQKDFIAYLKNEDGVLNAEWMDSSTLNITLDSNVLGGDSEEKAKKIAELAASDSSFILEREICVNIFYPDGKKLATKCAEYKPSE